MLSFWWKKVWQNIIHTLWSQIACFLPTTLALSTFGLFILIGINFNLYLKHWQRKIPIIAFFQNETLTEKARKTLITKSEIAQIDYISSQDAFQRLKTWLKGKELLLEGLDKNPLLPSLEIYLKPAFYKLDFINHLVQELKGLPGVAEVVYPSYLFFLVTTGWRFLKLVFLLIGVFLSVATVFIIANLIRLHLQKRREEIKIMRLLGASEGFIQVPFYIEGLWQGTICTGASILLLKGFHTWVNGQIKTLQIPFTVVFFDPNQILLFVGFGLFLGFTGSFLGLKK